MRSGCIGVRIALKSSIDNKYSSNIPTNVMYDRMNMLLCKRPTQGSRRPFTMIPPSSPGWVVCIATLVILVSRYVR